MRRRWNRSGRAGLVAAVAVLAAPLSGPAPAAADSVVCLNHHVCCTGAPHDVAENPEYLALFPETQIASLGIYTHHHDHAHAVTGEVVDAHDHAGHDHQGDAGHG